MINTSTHSQLDPKEFVLVRLSRWLEINKCHYTELWHPCIVDVVLDQPSRHKHILQVINDPSFEAAVNAQWMERTHRENLLHLDWDVLTDHSATISNGRLLTPLVELVLESSGGDDALPNSWKESERHVIQAIRQARVTYAPVRRLSGESFAAERFEPAVMERLLNSGNGHHSFTDFDSH